MKWSPRHAVLRVRLFGTHISKAKLLSVVIPLSGQILAFYVGSVTEDVSYPNQQHLMFHKVVNTLFFHVI